MKSLEALEKIKGLNHSRTTYGLWSMGMPSQEQVHIDEELAIIEDNLKKFIKIQAVVDEYYLIDEMTDKEFRETVIKIVERGER